MESLMGAVRAQQERLGLVESTSVSRRHPNDNTMRVDVVQRHALVESIMNAAMPGVFWVLGVLLVCVCIVLDVAVLCVCV